MFRIVFLLFVLFSFCFIILLMKKCFFNKKINNNKQILSYKKPTLSGYYQVYRTKKDKENSELSEDYFDLNSNQWDNDNLILERPFEVIKKL